MAVCDAKGRRASMPCTQRVAPQQRVSASLAAWRESAFRVGSGSADSAMGGTPHAQATHAAVGEDTQAQVRGRYTREQLAFEEVRCIDRELGFGQEREPGAALDQIRGPRAGRVDHVD